MECSTRWGVVARVSSLPGRQELLVRVGADEIKAICYPELIGHCQPGDGVLLNTTAVDLNLGTGGWHYVLAIEGRERSLLCPWPHHQAAVHSAAGAGVGSGRRESPTIKSCLRLTPWKV